MWRSVFSELPTRFGASGSGFAPRPVNVRHRVPRPAWISPDSARGRPPDQPQYVPYDSYPVAPAVSPAAHSAWRQLHAIDGRLAEPSQYAPQYLLPGSAGQLQPGCAHFSTFFSAIKTPWLLLQLPRSI